MAKKPRKARDPASAPPAGETKAQRFVRLGTARVNKAMKSIAVLGNLSNRSGYEYTQEQVDKIFNALGSKLKDVEVMFNAKAADKSADTIEL